jgi:hypothetical protein
MRMTRLVALAVALFGCTSTPPGARSDAASPISYPACHWPAAFDATDAGGGCRAGRFRLACDGGDAGLSVGCISDDPRQCDGVRVQPDVTFTCHDECAPNEFGLVCGGVGPGSAPSDPPAGCHSFSPTPGGIVFYCCPCS